ncbi:hypothetical protein BH09VER1_BH09VER1_48840 [soil metagenome]
MPPRLLLSLVLILTFSTSAPAGIVSIPIKDTITLPADDKPGSVPTILRLNVDDRGVICLSARAHEYVGITFTEPQTLDFIAALQKSLPLIASARSAGVKKKQLLASFGLNPRVELINISYVADNFGENAGTQLNIGNPKLIEKQSYRLTPENTTALITLLQQVPAALTRARDLHVQTQSTPLFTVPTPPAK